LVVLELGDEGTQWCGKYFADMGATVVKVEPRAGSPGRHRGPYKHGKPDVNASIHFWTYNTSKDSVTLDVEVEGDRALLLGMIAGADVMLEDSSPGYLADLGLDYDHLAPQFGRLIVTSVTPFGQGGPLQQWRGSDMICWAMGGAMSLVGYSDPNTPPLVPQGDFSYQLAGCWAVIGTLVALTQRESTGEGQHVDVSVQEACAFCVDGYDVSPYEYTGTVVRRRDGGAKTVTKDGKFLVPQITNVSDSRWLEFRDWLKAQGEGAELHDLDAAGMQANMEKVEEVIQGLADRRSGAELFALGQSFGFTWMVANAPEELLEDEHLRARGFFREVVHPEYGRSYTYGGPGAVWSESGWDIRARPPRLGEHNGKWGVSR
jgi:crotonobetainyl-CoA:carnitine CoA-transferase CaiB-like acyl-CoA transferase